MLKRCSRCKVEKCSVDFSKCRNNKDGLRYQCKECDKKYKKPSDKNVVKEYNKQYRRSHYQENREEDLLKSKHYYQDHKISINEYKKIWSLNKRQNDLVFRLRQNVSNLVNKVLTANVSSKMNESITDYIPYTIQQLKQYLEIQFESWMTWDNYGKYDVKSWDDNDPSTWMWNIDHIIPQSLLPYSSMGDDNFQKCWALSNLRPLSSKQNMMDGNRR